MNRRRGVQCILSKVPTIDIQRGDELGFYQENIIVQRKSLKEIITCQTVETKGNSATKIALLLGVCL